MSTLLNLYSPNFIPVINTTKLIQSKLYTGNENVNTTKLIQSKLYTGNVSSKMSTHKLGHERDYIPLIHLKTPSQIPSVIQHPLLAIVVLTESSSMISDNN